MLDDSEDEESEALQQGASPQPRTKTSKQAVAAAPQQASKAANGYGFIDDDEDMADTDDASDQTGMSFCLCPIMPVNLALVNRNSKRSLYLAMYLAMLMGWYSTLPRHHMCQCNAERQLSTVSFLICL